MSRIRLGIIGNSKKENEHRLPIHPLHVASVDDEIRGQILLERGYGERFGVADDRLAPHVAGLLPRTEIFAQCDVVLLFKPLLQDFLDIREGQVLWGCPHFVQDTQVTQTCIDRRLTVIAIEGMQHWSTGGAFTPFFCPRIGEMAGYCSVQHALTCVGRTGIYGRRLRAAVIGYGSAGRGAVAALSAQSIYDTTIFTRRPSAAVLAAPGSAQGARLTTGPDDGDIYATAEAGDVKLSELLTGYDIIVNCVRQDTNAPDVFLTNNDIPALTPGTLIIDVSCDTQMGFSWARPTSFSKPIVNIGNNVQYYAVDHSPSYLWDSATWVLSEAMMPYLRTVVSGEKAWEVDTTICRAVEIRRGVIQNPDILSFQRRSLEYPHVFQ